MNALAAKRRVTSEYIDDASPASSLGNQEKPRRRRRVVRATASTLWLGLAALYLWCPVHRFPSARAFHGARWYNPYAAVTLATRWQKANLHAHARAWSGLTNGRGTADDVLRRYRAMGYDVAPVSDYQAITRARGADPTSLTAYEHGFNVRKVHLLAVGARRVDWLDYPLLQGRDEVQHRIDRLQASSEMVIIAHPWLRDALSDVDLRALTGYTAIEIGSSFGRSEHAWNVALDAGRAVWGVANDDLHDVDGPNESGSFWTMIAAPSSDARSLETALSAGQAYAVFGRGGRAGFALSRLSIVGDTLSVSFQGSAANLELVGPGGRVLATVANAREARWTIPCDAGWVRVVARTPTTRISLEPVLRSENGSLPRVNATLAPTPTLVRRTMALLLLLIAILPWIGRDVLRFSSFSRADAMRSRPALRDAA